MLLMTPRAVQRLDWADRLARYLVTPAFLAVVVLTASPAFAQRTITAHAEIGDKSTPRDDITWSAFCYYRPPFPPAGPNQAWTATPSGDYWFVNCSGIAGVPIFGGPPSYRKLPLGDVELQVEVDRDPVYVWAEPNDASSGEYYKTYAYPRCTDLECAAVPIKFFARAGSVEGYVRLIDGTPVPGVTVAAYDKYDALAATTVADGSGYFIFKRQNATDREIGNHWALPVDPEEGWSPPTPVSRGSFSIYQLVASPIGVSAAWPLSGSPNADVTIGNSELARRDLLLVQIQSPQAGQNPASATPPDPCQAGQAQPEAPPETDCQGCPGEPVEAPQTVGEPVNVITGEVLVSQTDIALAGGRHPLALQRTYNSGAAYSGRVGAFGRGWTHSYEKSLTEVAGDRILRLRRGDGAPVFFGSPAADGHFSAVAPVRERSGIVKSGGTYTRLFTAGGYETYDASGLLVGQTDRVGSTTTLSRDGQGRLTAISAPNSRTLTFGYDGNHVSSLSGPEGLIASYAYDGDLLTKVIYADGSGYTFDYDPDGELLSVTDLQGTLVEAHAYAGGKGLTSERAEGRERYTFSYESGRTVVTDALGAVTTYSFAPFGGRDYVTRVEGPCASCGGRNLEGQWTYDSNGGVSAFVNATGQRIEYTYDAAGKVLTETEVSSDGTTRHVTTYTRDAYGRIETLTTPDGATRRWTYGMAGPTSITDPLQRTATVSYGVGGSVEGLALSITDARGKTATFGYNGAGDLMSVTDPLGHSTTFGYDGVGRRITVTDPLEQTTETLYDARGRVRRVTRPDGTHSDFTYDLGGRRTSATDAAGRVTRYRYDPAGDLSAIQDALGGVTQFRYDSMARLGALTDAKGQTTRFEHDALHRLHVVVSPDGAAESYTYDDAGRLLTRTDRNGVVTNHEYDGFGRLIETTYSDGTPPLTYSYDSVGRPLSASNGTDALNWTYDVAGQLITEASAKNGTIVSYSYDLGGNRQGLSLDGASFLSYSYDDAGRLVGLDRGPSHFGFGYDAASRRISLSFPNGVVTSYAYDGLSQLTSVGTVHGMDPVTQFGYTYDTAGNRTTKSSLDSTESYAYDLLDRLVGVERNGSSANHWHYDYDAVGNRRSEQVGQSVLGASYDSRNQLLSRDAGGPLRVRGRLDEPGTATVNGQPAALLSSNVFEATIDASSGPNTVTIAARDASGNVRTNTYQVDVDGAPGAFTYDANGNLTSKSDASGSWTYAWNARNQLVRVSKDGIEVGRYAYDPRGRRVEKTASGVTTRFAYDGLDIVQETTSTGTSLRYVHGPGIDEPLARQDGTGTGSYYHADGLGSIVATTNGAGAVASTRRYDAYGNPELGGDQPGYAFTGREWDPEIGLYYFRARYYDPKLGRFTSEDPIGVRGGINLYAYVLGNPTNLVDPTGTEAYVVTGGGHAGLVVRDATSRTGYTRFDYYGEGADWNIRGWWDAVAGTKGQVALGPSRPGGLRIETTLEQERRLLELMEERYRNPGEYNVIGNNCVDQARDILRRVGVPIPAGGAVDTPEKLRSDVQWYLDHPSLWPVL
jgi:RHS repeat-associated protein